MPGVGGVLAGGGPPSSPLHPPVARSPSPLLLPTIPWINLPSMQQQKKQYDEVCCSTPEGPAGQRKMLQHNEGCCFRLAPQRCRLWDCRIRLPCPPPPPPTSPPANQHCHHPAPPHHRSTPPAPPPRRHRHRLFPNAAEAATAIDSLPVGAAGRRDGDRRRGHDAVHAERHTSTSHFAGLSPHRVPAPP